ncbi:hypothetical protein C7M52_03367 [Mixta theicola]|nr:hypothetical protein C7M52_03367 [Mixta theicola]
MLSGKGAFSGKARPVNHNGPVRSAKFCHRDEKMRSLSHEKKAAADAQSRRPPGELADDIQGNVDIVAGGVRVRTHDMRGIHQLLRFCAIHARQINV